MEVATLLGKISIDGVDRAESDVTGFGKAFDRMTKGVVNGAVGVGKAGGILTQALAVFTGGALLNTVSAATSVVSDFFTDGFTDARGAAKLMAQTEAVITSTGAAAGRSVPQIAEFASSLSDAAGKSLFGDDQIQDAENFLLTFTNIKGEVLDGATQIATDMAQALGTEPQAQALALGKALNDPTNGLTALTRIGVTFTDQQKDQIKAMQEAGDMAGAQGVILNELGKEFGGSALAAAQAAGPWAQLQGVIGETAESIAGQFMPLIDQVGQALLDPAVQAGISTFVDNLVNGITSVVNAGKLLFTGDFQGGIFGLEEDDPIIDTLFRLRETAIAVFTWFTTEGLPGLQATFVAVWPVITAAVSGFASIIETSWPTIQSLFVALRDAVITFAQALMGDWTNSEQITAFHTVVGNLGLVVHDVFGWLTNTAMPALSAAFTAAWPVIRSAVEATYTFLSGTVWPWLRTAFDWVTGTGIPALQSAWSTAWPVIQSTVSTVYTFLSGTVWPWLSEAFTNISTWVNTASTTWSTAWNTISTTTSTAISTIKGTFDTLSTAASTAINTTVTFFQGLPGKITGAVGDLSGILTSAGRQIIDGLLAGINSAWGAVQSRLSQLTSMIPEWKGPMDVDAKLLYENGRVIMGSLIDGMDAGMPNVQNMLMDLTGSLSSESWAQTTADVEQTWLTIAHLIQDPMRQTWMYVQSVTDLIRRSIKSVLQALDDLDGVSIPNGAGGGGNNGGGGGGGNLFHAFAGGVQNFHGGAALVGERGPELVTLPRGANVYPAPQTRAMLQQSSGTVTNDNRQIHINVTATPGATREDGRMVAQGIHDELQSLGYR